MTLTKLKFNIFFPEKQQLVSSHSGPNIQLKGNNKIKEKTITKAQIKNMIVKIKDITINK